MAEILGIGTALPEHRIDRERAVAYASTVSCTSPEERRKLSVLYRRTGIGNRGSVLLESDSERQVVQSFYPPARSASDRGPSTEDRNDRYADEAPRLAIDAATRSLQQAGIGAPDVTHLITVSCTGFNAPGVDIALIDGLGLPVEVERIQIGFMGCHAAINGLRVARGLVAAEPQARVLICCIELCTLHYQYGFDANRIVSGALFADGAAAMVVVNGSGSPARAGRLTGDRFGGGQHGTAASVDRLEATGSYLIPASRDAMTWRIGNNGFEMTLSAKVPELILTHLGGYMRDWLGRHGETIAAIGGWAAHPGGARILTAVEQSLGLAGDALATPREVLTEHGNMSSATMPIILDWFRRSGQPKPWVMLGFGPGLEVEVALIR